MTKLKKQLADLPENERLVLAQELVRSLSEQSFNRFVAHFFSSAFIDRMKRSFQQWQPANQQQSQNDLPTEEGAITGEEMKAWIRQQIAESESRYAEQMKSGQVKTFSLAELKAELNG